MTMAVGDESPACGRNGATVLDVFVPAREDYRERQAAR